jgi:tRNA(Ile)-lysidine synthase
MKFLSEKIKAFCLEHGFDRTYWIALSGGLDSTVLLHLLVNLRTFYPLRLRVIHVHHGLSPHADVWLQHCEAICREYAVELTNYFITVKVKTGESLEAIARQQRYEVFLQQMQHNDILLTGHHQEDQAETVLLQLFRGAGPKGLAAMPQFVSFQQGFHGRPFLDCSRQMIRAYAEYHQLHWVDDESNENINFTRNFMRHEVLPLLQTRWPNITETIARSANHCAETQMLLDSFLQQDLIACAGSQPKTLSVSQLLLLSDARQRQVVRLWLSQNHFSIPSTIKMQHILQDMLHSRQDKLPHVIWGDHEMRRYRDDLYILPVLQAHEASKDFPWDLSQSLELKGVGVLQASPVIGEGLRADIGTVTVRFRRGGEEFHLPGRSHHHSLKKLFQTWGVLPWMRDRIPLVFVENQLAAVVGYAVAEEFKARDGEQGLLLTLTAGTQKVKFPQG